MVGVGTHSPTHSLTSAGFAWSSLVLVLTHPPTFAGFWSELVLTHSPAHFGRLRVELDGELVSPPGGFSLRKAPGHAAFDFRQTLKLRRDATDAQAGDAHAADAAAAAAHAAAAHAAASGRLVPIVQDYVAPVLPRAHTWRFRFLSTWGDPHYMGLDAIQLFGVDGAPLSRPPMRAYAAAADVDALAAGDPRTAQKLFLPLAESAEAAPPTARSFADAWLSPWEPESATELWLVFEQPVSLALLRVRNYSKSPERGVNDFELFGDDLLVFKGQLRRNDHASTDSGESGASGDSGAGGASGASGAGGAWQSVLFTDDAATLKREAERARGVFAAGDEHVLLINDGRLVNPSVAKVVGPSAVAGLALAPTPPPTAVDPLAGPPMSTAFNSYG